MESQFVLNVRRSAEDSFASGLYCAESVVLAIADELGVESELLPKVATASCSGMGRMCGTCGALSGAIMGIGLALGRSEAGESVHPAYSATQHVASRHDWLLLQGHQGDAMNQSGQCALADGFSLWQKVYAQGTFFTFIIAASVGIARADWPWLVPYALVCWYGVPGIIMRHLTCPRCAHLHRHGDCLQFPAKWAARLVKERKTTPFTPNERRMFHFIFIFLPVYPIYWLLPQPALLTIFGISAVMWYLGQWLYFCKRCRVDSCPYNRAALSFPP